MTAEAQVQLWGETPDLEYDPAFPLSDLPPSGKAEVDASLVASIRHYGQLVPIHVRRLRVGTGYEVIDGRRRVAALRVLGRETAQAYRVSEVDRAVGHALTLVLNAQRGRNAVAELEAIDQLLRQGATAGEIARATGMTVPELRQRLRLHGLSHTLRTALVRGQVAYRTAVVASSLPKSVQEHLEKVVTESGKLTSGDVKAARQVQAQTAAEAVSDLFGEPVPLSLRAELLGHTATIAALLRGESVHPFPRVRAALAALEEAVREETGEA